MPSNTTDFLYVEKLLVTRHNPVEAQPATVAGQKYL